MIWVLGLVLLVVLLWQEDRPRLTVLGPEYWAGVARHDSQGPLG